jgi:hypothetical protein
MRARVSAAHALLDPTFICLSECAACGAQTFPSWLHAQTITSTYPADNGFDVFVSNLQL